MTVGRCTLGTIATLSLVAGFGLELASREASGHEASREQPVLAEVPADVVAAVLAAARDDARGGPLPAGFKLLDELTLPHATLTEERSPLFLTPEVASLLARNGMQPFLMRALRGAGRGPGSRAPLGGDVTPPVVTWVTPSPGANLTPEVSTTLDWTATDPSGILFQDVFASFDGGTTFLPVALGLDGSTTILQWFPPYRPGSTILRVEATDGALNMGNANRTVTVTTVLDSLLPTTLRDFDLPGTQPLEHGLDLRDPTECSFCHADYDPAQEPYFAWSGSMMANASLDPLFEACLTIAEQDAAGSGDLCIRCHVPAAWVAGRSTPTDGSQIQASDRTGVSCDHCHRMLDPIYDPLENPPDDADILAELLDPPSEFGTGSYVLDPYGTRRGPFDDVVCAHTFLVSPFHREAELCATCHNVSNPAFESDGMGGYTATFDQAAAAVGHGDVMPIERTYSEWLASDYNSPGGVYAPEFGGNRDYVGVCQDCHLRAVDGQACNPSIFPDAPYRDDLPFHDLTGGNTWVPTLLDDLYPGQVDPLAVAAAAERARAMLQKAADLAAHVQDSTLVVSVINDTGHKLPTGYPDGRRMWLNVKFFDAYSNLIAESGHYDPATGVLTEDAQIKVYEMEAGLDTDVALLTGLPAGPSFHFVLNNKVYKDNRIPPRGFTNSAFAAFGGAPVDATYADGQHWDLTTYTIPSGANSVEVTLYYQTTTKEYVEFLRDENVTDTKGQEMYDLWEDNGRSPPEEMAQLTRALDPRPSAPVPIPKGRPAQH